VILAGDGDSKTNPAILTADDREPVLRANIERMLEARVGPGRAVVEVSVDANMDSQTVTERLIDPASRVVISSETEESKESAEGSTPGVTVASNLPDGEAGGLGDSNRTTSLISERQNFEISETTTERVILPGQIKRISVAVMVDGLMKKAPDGVGEIWSPRPQEELDVLRLLVQSVIGFDVERGDSVTIESLQFSAPPVQGTFAESPGAGFLARYGARLAQIGALVLIVLALVLLVLRPMLGRRSDVVPAELAGPDGWAGSPAGRIGADQNGVLDLESLSGARIDRLRDVIASRSEDSAAVFRKWIEAPETPKEPAGS
jgi:flagellar M-ring protein FliF